MLKKLYTKLNQQHKIILCMTILFLIGSSYLFSIDSRYSDPRYNQDWFSLSFSQARSDKLDFVVENFSSESDFHWEVLNGEKKISEGTLSIAPESKIETPVTIDPREKGKIVIRVSSPKESKEIYKNIEE